MASSGIDCNVASVRGQAGALFSKKMRPGANQDRLGNISIGITDVFF